MPKLTFVLGVTLLIGGAATLITIGSDLPQRLASVLGSHTMADNGLSNPEPGSVQEHAKAANGQEDQNKRLAAREGDAAGTVLEGKLRAKATKELEKSSGNPRKVPPPPLSLAR